MRQRVAEQKREFAKRLRADSTDAEMALWTLLRSRRLAAAKFRRQVPIGPFILDFVSFEHRLVVEADGSQPAENLRDVKRDLDLSQRGFEILRFWNNDILVRPALVAEAIYQKLIIAPSPQPSPTRGEGAGRAPAGRSDRHSPQAMPLHREAGEGGSRREPSEGAFPISSQKGAPDV
jgi:very-short-patch-repair endonuclease